MMGPSVVSEQSGQLKEMLAIIADPKQFAAQLAQLDEHAEAAATAIQKLGDQADFGGEHQHAAASF